MCFSAEASAGVAAAILPVGGYCLATAWRKARAYLLLAMAPLFFGLQQLCEARVWDAMNRGDTELARAPSLAFLFFAFAIWPVWIPAAVTAIEPPGRKRWAFIALTGMGMLFGAMYYLPVVTDGLGLHPVIVGHSIRYDFSAVALVRSGWWWVGPLLYMATTCGPLLASHDRHLRPLGIAFVVSGIITYAVFASAFASVWCFFATILSLYLTFVLHQLPDPTRTIEQSIPGV